MLGVVCCVVVCCVVVCCCVLCVVVCLCVLCVVCCVLWVGEWRLVGQGLHHTSFTCTIQSSQHQRIFFFFDLFLLILLFCRQWDLCRRSICVSSMLKPWKRETRRTWQIAQAAKLVVRACRSRAHSRERCKSDKKRPASYVLRDGVCHKVVMTFMHHTTDAVSPLCFAHHGFLAFPSAYKEACHRSMPIMPFCSKNMCYRACVSFWCVRRYTHLGLCARRTGSFNISDCQSCFTCMTLRASGLAVLTAPQLVKPSHACWQK